MAFIWRRRSTSIVKIVIILTAIWFTIAFLIYTDDNSRRGNGNNSGSTGNGGGPSIGHHLPLSLKSSGGSSGLGLNNNGAAGNNNGIDNIGDINNNDIINNNEIESVINNAPPLHSFDKHTMKNNNGGSSKAENGASIKQNNNLAAGEDGKFH